MKILNSIVLSFILPNTIFADEQASVILNKNNYHDKVAKGVWFVKFYAPWCKFSKRLAPTWTKFTEAQKSLSNEHDFYFGEVDCQANGDLCNEFKIDGYPTLLLQNSKGTIEEYMGEQGESDLAEYAQKQAKEAKSEGSESSNQTEVKPESSKVEELKDTEAHKIKVETDNHPYPSTNGEVKELNREEFQKAVDAKDTWIMKFYIPTCPHCQAMAPIYKKLASAYKDKVKFGEVNCQQNTDLCSEQVSKGVPHFKIFYKGNGETEITGEVTQDKLRSMVQDFTTPTFVELNSKEIKLKESDSDPSLVYFGNGKDDEAYKTKFQDNMIGLDLMTDSVVYSQDKDLKSSLSTQLKNTRTLFMISKDGIFEYTDYPLDDFRTLKNWINIHKYPLDYQLTTSSLHQALEKYIVVLKLSQTDEPSDDLANAAKEYRQDSDSINKTPVLFGHGSADLTTPLYLLGVPKPSALPYTLIINPEKAAYFDKGESGNEIELDSEHLLHTLHAIQENKIQGEALVPKTGYFIRDHFYIVVFGVLGACFIGYIIYKKRNGGFQYSKVE